MKSNSCCGGEEDDSAAEANDCCKDENFIIKNSPDFTIKQFHNYDFLKTFSDLFYVSLPFTITNIQNVTPTALAYTEASPPPLQQAGVISVSVLRI